jgi:ribonuclease P protein component
VIGKKSVKLAVERNRLKRLMRDSFRLNQQLLAGLDIVIVARKGLGEVENRIAPTLWQALEATGSQSALSSGQRQSRRGRQSNA